MYLCPFTYVREGAAFCVPTKGGREEVRDVFLAPLFAA
jgi:hypothetical protein